MAKEKTESGKFQISESVKRDGYLATVDGAEINIGFELSHKGEKNSAFASVGEGYGKLFKGSGKDYLEDLSDEQVRVLTLAGVIVLTPEQETKYKKIIHP